MSNIELGFYLHDTLLANLNREPSSTPERFSDLCARFKEQFIASEPERAQRFNEEEDAFRESCYKRWRSGLDLLQVFRQFCIEAGTLFQKEICRHEDYRSDPLLGVLMRQHANACRIMGEVEALLRSGYPDGALARWLTLHETAVTSILVRRFGRSAAEDFVRCGLMEIVRGMEGYEESLKDRGRIPFSHAKFDVAKRTCEKAGSDKASSPSASAWAVPHADTERFEQLQESAGLGEWKDAYKWASQNVHANYREMRTLLGMAEAGEDGLLVGSSDSGFAAPARFSAIALAQTTSTFITCYMDEEDCPIDFTCVSVALPTIDHLVREIERRFAETEN
jgi:hypothetical protein